MKKFFSLLLFFLFIQTGYSELKSETRIALGTFFQITIEETKDNKEILNQAFKKVDELEKKLSIFEKESEVSKLNKNKSASISNETIEVIKKAIEISKITDGAFDISCKPLVDLYKKCEKSGKPPGEEEIKNTLTKVNWKNIEIKGNNISLKDGMEIDLGGIAKGYIVDKAVEFLKSKGIKNGLVNAGGDLYCWGNNPSGKKWKIAIRDPFEKEKTIGKIEITEKGVATSGDYEQYVKIKGQKFSHIVDPRNGKTVQDFPVSITIIADDCITADALATGFFVIGTKSIEIANKLKDVEILIIDKDKKNYKSKNFPL